MTKREFKKKHNALTKEREKIIKSHTKAIQFLLGLTKTRDLLTKKIKELEAGYCSNNSE